MSKSNGSTVGGGGISLGLPILIIGLVGTFAVSPGTTWFGASAHTVGLICLALTVGIPLALLALALVVLVVVGILKLILD